MKKVKTQKTRLQKYQSYINKKVSVVCAMTLLVSTLLSPLATSANTTNHSVYISPVSDTQKISDEYVNVELSYYDIEESQLSVKMDVNVNLDSVVMDEEQVEIIEQPSNNNEENSEVEEQPESNENPIEIVEDSIDNNTEKIVEKLPVTNEDEIIDAPSDETDMTEQVSHEKSETIDEIDQDLIKEEEAILEETIESELVKPVTFTNSKSIFSRMSQWLMNVFNPFTLNSEVIAEAAEVEEKSIIIDFPIHSSFSLDEDDLVILGKNDEELQPSSSKIESNRMTVGFTGDIPKQFSVLFSLNRSEFIESGDVIINEDAVIQYRVEESSETSEIKLPTMNVNLYLLNQVMPLPSLDSSFYNSISNESSSDTSSHQVTVDLGNNNKLYLDKTAELQDDGSYLIKLNTSGEVQATTTLNKADIVLVVDSSGSMNEQIGKMKTFIKNFTKQILSLNTEANPDLVRVAIVNYADNAKSILTNDFVTKYTTCKNETACKFPNILDWFPDENKDSVQYKIESMDADGGTNTDAGIQKAAELLTAASNETGRSGAQQYIVFFTDGLPTYNSTYEGDRGYAGGNGSSHWDRNFRAAQISYYENFNGPLRQTNSNEITIGGIGSKRNNQNNVFDGEVSYTIKNQSPLNSKFYSIGLFEGSENSTAIKFLKTIQNAVPENEYKENYYTNDINGVEDIYVAIENEIEKEIKGNLLTGVTITDIVPDYLSIVEASFNEVPTEVLGNKITWTFDKLTEDGVELSFTVKPNDPYLAGTNVPTNDRATIKADEIGTLEGELFPVPTVNIDQIQGGIKVDKQVITSDGTPFNTNEKFSINVKRVKNNQIQEQLGFNVAGNNVDETVSFYLKGEQTNISFNKDTSKNYLTAGTYSVDEIVPGNYEQTSIDVAYCDENYKNCKRVKEGDTPFTSTDTFELDMNHRYIKITIVNKLVNENYWYDKANIMNQIIYN